MRHGFLLTRSQATQLRKIVRHYKPKMGKSWRKCGKDELWLRILSQIVVAGNAAPGYVLQRSAAARQILSFSKLKKLRPKRRRRVIHNVLQAIGTRYVGTSSKNRKVDAALHNFEVLANAGGPRQFFKEIASMKSTKEKIDFLSGNLAFYKKKGCRDTLIELRLASNCLALDQRLRNILEGVGARVPQSIDKHYEEIERELINRVAKPCGLSGGKLDRILFQNYGDIMVRLLRP
jgi:hypothetical protein